MVSPSENSSLLCAMVCEKNSKPLTEIHPPEHLLAGWKKFVTFIGKILLQHFQGKEKNPVISISVYSFTWLDMKFCLYICKFHTGTNTNPFSWLKRRGSWLTQTQLKSHIPSLLSHLVPCFKLTKAGSKSLAVQVDSPILIHIF